MTTVPPRNRPTGPESRVAVAPLEDPSTFADRADAALKSVILSLDIYEKPGEVRLDERQLASDLGISRTPVREAMAQLEREGFVRSVPRRGIYVVRKTKQEVIELITAWAALESMAARLITQNASDQEIAELRKMFARFENGELHARLDEYSEVNIEFHQSIIRMSRNGVLIDLAENLFTHMRMIRRKTIGEDDRATRSIRDHMNIIQALEARDLRRGHRHHVGVAPRQIGEPRRIVEPNRYQADDDEDCRHNPDGLPPPDGGSNLPPPPDGNSSFHPPPNGDSNFSPPPDGGRALQLYVHLPAVGCRAVGVPARRADALAGTAAGAAG